MEYGIERNDSIHAVPPLLEIRHVPNVIERLRNVPAGKANHPFRYVQAMDRETVLDQKRIHRSSGPAANIEYRSTNWDELNEPLQMAQALELIPLGSVIVSNLFVSISNKIIPHRIE